LCPEAAFCVSSAVCDTYEGRILSQFYITANKVRFYYELCITEDYNNKAYYWLDQEQKEYQYLGQELRIIGINKIIYLKVFPQTRSVCY